MARNTGNNSRKGAVSKRTQIFNASTGHYIKRDTTTGKFIEVKTDGTKFKGVRIEKTPITFKANPNVKRSIAIKAERAVFGNLKKTSSQPRRGK
jgi:hypothetical protein